MRKIDEAYEFIKNYINEKDYPPTIREIGDAINIKSTSTISYYLHKLEEDNKIVKSNYKNRSIQLMESLSSKLDNCDIITLPYINKITNGQPLMNEKNIGDKFMFSGSLFKGLNMFLMPVQDDLMQKSGILKGDIVVVSRQNVARNGEVVVAVDGLRYIIARLYKEYDYLKLQQDNKPYDPIYAEKVMILGKVVGVIRNNIL
ncbi:MAG: repressor LexA [Clostridia bacterium]|nr:repressor LexA [Clostridia bacterium]